MGTLRSCRRGTAAPTASGPRLFFDSPHRRIGDRAGIPREIQPESICRFGYQSSAQNENPLTHRFRHVRGFLLSWQEIQMEKPVSSSPFSAYPGP